MTLQPGAIFQGKYRVEHVLGEGGMGIVLAATHITLGQRVAIKFLRGPGSMRQDVVERFVREARAAAKIQGAHVAKVIDVGADEAGVPYMVMEYLDGEDLSQRLEHAQMLPIPEACRWVIQACEAIAEAHAAGIVHRDLKPSNLFLAKQPSGEHIVKVLDFGISKDLSAAPAESLTRTAAVMGTAFYMSPEQLQSAKHVDRRTDIWALGVILYELLAGKVPFDAETLPEVIGLILTNQPPPIESVRHEIPPPLATAIRRAMASSLGQRYRNVAEFASDLAPFVGTAEAFASAGRARAILGDAPVVQVQAGAFSATISDGEQTQIPQSFVKAPRTRPWLPIAAVTFVVAVCVATGLFVYHARAPQAPSAGATPPETGSAAAQSPGPTSPAVLPPPAATPATTAPVVPANPVPVPKSTAATSPRVPRPKGAGTGAGTGTSPLGQGFK